MASPYWSAIVDRVAFIHNSIWPSESFNDGVSEAAASVAANKKGIHFKKDIFQKIEK
jgi:hypothetical protein